MAESNTHASGDQLGFSQAVGCWVTSVSRWASVFAGVALLTCLSSPWTSKPADWAFPRQGQRCTAKQGGNTRRLLSCHFHPSAIGHSKSHWPSPKLRGQEMHSALRELVAGDRAEGEMGVQSSPFQGHVLIIFAFLLFQNIVFYRLGSA